MKRIIFVAIISISLAVGSLGTTAVMINTPEMVALGADSLGTTVILDKHGKLRTVTAPVCKIYVIGKTAFSIAGTDTYDATNLDVPKTVTDVLSKVSDILMAATIIAKQVKGPCFKPPFTSTDISALPTTLNTWADSQSCFR